MLVGATAERSIKLWCTKPVNQSDPGSHAYAELLPRVVVLAPEHAC
jgi:hypothetical protein